MTKNNIKHTKKTTIKFILQEWFAGADSTGSYEAYTFDAIKLGHKFP